MLDMNCLLEAISALVKAMVFGMACLLFAQVRIYYIMSHLCFYCVHYPPLSELGHWSIL